jgi:hypothetical protein
MKLGNLFMITLLTGTLSATGCGEDEQEMGGTGSIDGAGSTGGAGGAGRTGGVGGGVPYQVCTLGLCMEDESIGASCLEVYDRCVGQGHYPRSCRMDADKTCSVFGETGPY